MYFFNLYINIFTLDLTVENLNILVYHKKSYFHIILEFHLYSTGRGPSPDTSGRAVCHPWLPV